MEYGLLGKKLGHSFSKEIHNLIGDYDYLMIEKEENEIKEFFENENFKAINVTIPYKETVIPFLDEISENAKMIGSVNTIVRKDGKLYGYNTDFVGFSDLLKRADIDVENKKVLILGTGGTSKTAFAVCKSQNAKEVYKVSRVENDYAISYTRAVEEHSDADVIINTTPCGMYPDNENIAIDIDLFKSLEGVVDVIYNPLVTPFLKKAKDRKLKYTNGLYMLVRQAVRASELFFDKEYDEEITQEVYKKVLLDKENIVLTGMPGSGKTTIGKLLSERMGRAFVDTDEETIKKYKTQITDIFEKYGEEKFRQIETETIKEVSKRNGIIISTGGGAVLKKENIDYLKQNSKIFFLDRDIEYLVPTADRPTANSREKIMKLYDERIGIYLSTADEKIKVENDALKAAEEIERRRS